MTALQADERPGGRAGERYRETALGAALDALVPATEAVPAWADVLRRAAALPVCTCARGTSPGPD